MKNKVFNQKITDIFYSTPDNEELISLISDLWLENDTTQIQDETLERIKNAAWNESLSSIAPYLLKESK